MGDFLGKNLGVYKEEMSFTIGTDLQRLEPATTGNVPRQQMRIHHSNEDSLIWRESCVSESYQLSINRVSNKGRVGFLHLFTGLLKRACFMFYPEEQHTNP